MSCCQHSAHKNTVAPCHCPSPPRNNAPLFRCPTPAKTSRLFMSVSSVSRNTRPTFDPPFNGHISREIISVIKNSIGHASLWGGGVGVARERVYIRGGRRAFPSHRHPAAMAFNGTWKVDRSENYDKFMEQMGEPVHLRLLSG